MQFATGFSLENITIDFPAITDQGLRVSVYSGYFADDVNWFAPRTPTTTTTAYPFLSGTTTEGISYQWLGWFKPLVSATYTFQTISDDASYMWLGNNAVSGFTTGNALINNGGYHNSQTVEASITLAAGFYYPVRLQWGNYQGTGEFYWKWYRPGTSATIFFNDLIWYGNGMG